MKKAYSFIFAVLFLSGVLANNADAQLSGTKTIPGDYASISAAITALNSAGVGTGGVTFNVAAGYTETASALIITATGTSANPIIFQKSGSGANPIITAGVGVGTMDGIILLSGSDYVTFDGFDLKESAANTTTTTQMEWGFALLKVDGTNGSQYNTIKNCNITLAKTNTSSYGIYSANHTTAATTALVVTARAGANSFNKYYSNTIQNVYSGIWMGGYADATSPYDFYDNGNDIGSLGGNTIRWFGGSSVASYGIYTIYQDSILVNNNNIGGGSGGTLTNYGIMLSTATNASVVVYNNTISDTTATTTSASYGIALSNAGVTGTNNTVVVKRNTVQGMTATAITTGALYGYYIYYTTAMNLYVDSNKFINNKWGPGTTTNTGTIYGFYIYPYTTAPTAGSYEYITNNYISGNIRKQSAISTGSYYGMYIYYGQANVNTYNNIFEYDTLTTTSTVYHMYVYNYYATAVNYYNNIVRNIYKAGGSTGSYYGIYLSNAAYSGTFNFYNNSVNNIKVGAAASTIYGIYNASTAVTKNSYGNSVYSLQTSLTGSVYGYYQSGGTNVYTYKNSVYDLRTASGFGYGLTIGSGTTNYIYNNYISDIRVDSLSTTLALMGLYISGGTTDYIYYNTVYLNSVSQIAGLFGTAGLYVSTTPTVDMRNNLIVNKSTPGTTGGYSVAHYRSSGTLTTYAATSNNNCFYAGTPDTNKLVYYDGASPIKTIADYRLLVTPRDAYSVTENPPFVNVSTKPYDLRINAAIATQLESGGTTISSPSIVDDFDGQARYPNTGYPVNPSYPPTSPDIGADEFGGIPLDATPPNIIYAPLWHTTSTTARTLTATITDPHGVPTSGTGLPVLYWKINSGSYTAVTATSLGAGQFSFTFGSGVVTNDIVSYFICAQDTLLNVGSFPFAGASGYIPNPPAVTIPPTNPSKYVIAQAGLAGDYTVGATLFNKTTGKNITFKKVVTKVMKEVIVEDLSIKKPPLKGEIIKDETSASSTVKGRKELREVEEVKWVPMDNGKVYDGPLYIKKSESPNFSYPEGVNGIYATLTAAINDLNIRGVLGATRFLLTDTAYSTGETFPLVINILNTTKPTSANTITFKPNTGVVARISGAAAGTYVFRTLESFVTIDGSNTTGGTTRDLTIQNTSAIVPTALSIVSTGTTPITNVTIKNSNIINGATTSSSIILRDSAGAAGYFNNITFQNNNMQQAYMGFYCNAVIATGNGSGLLITGNDLNTALLPVRLVKIYIQGVDGAVVSNNNIGNDSNGTDASNITGIWLATGTINTTLSGNNIMNIYGYGPPRGIAVSSAVANANITITGNNISNLKTAYSSPPYGIYVFSTTSYVSITKNKVTGLLNTNTGGYGARGINVATSISPAGIDVINNFVSNIVCTSDASVTYYDVGIGIDGTISGVNVYYNSVNLFGAFAGYTSATVSTALYIASGVSNLNLRNNAFINSYNNLSSTTDKSYAIYTAGTNTAFTDINYNDYYASDSAGVLGYLSAAQSTLALWRTATGKDLNSVSDVPQFIDTTNLHINPLVYSVLSNAGTPIATVTDDIDGNTRNLTQPDIGGDEFTAVAPVLLSPANNSTGNPLSLNLVWTKPSGSTGNYGLMLATDAAFTNVLINDTTLVDTVYALTNLTPYTTYYWKVNTKLAVWGSYSFVSNFKTLGTATQVVLASPANNSTGQPVNITFKWYKATDLVDVKNALTKGIKTNKKDGKQSSDFAPLTISKYWFEYGIDSTFASVLGRDSSLTDTTKSLTGLNTGTTYYWRVKAKNQIGWGNFSIPFKLTTYIPYLQLDFKAYLEGFWDGTTQVSDTVRVYLANGTTPYTYTDTAKVVLSTTGTASVQFTRASSGSYYIVVNHRNHLETWSRLPQSFTAGTPLSYDFTTDSAKAYGYNMKKVGTAWVFYGGDANQDGSIDGLDIVIFVPQYGTQGYLSCDFNGDGDVTAADVIIISANYGLTKAVPTLLNIFNPPVKKSIDMIDIMKKVNTKKGNTNQNLDNVRKQNNK